MPPLLFQRHSGRKFRQSIAKLRGQHARKRAVGGSDDVCVVSVPPVSQESEDTVTLPANVSDVELVPLDLDEFIAEHDVFMSMEESPEVLNGTLPQDPPCFDSIVSIVSGQNTAEVVRGCTHVEIAAELEQMGLHDHLVFAIQRREAHIKTVANRYALFLEWLLDTHDRFKECTLDTLQLHIKIFIAEEYDVLISYVQYLSQHKHYQPATVVGHLDDIRLCCMWFVLFRNKRVVAESRMDQPEMLGFNTSIKHVRRIMNKKVQKQSMIAIETQLNINPTLTIMSCMQDKKKRSEQTMTSLVQLRLLPEGDPRTQLQTLQQEVLNQFMWIRQHDAKQLPVDKDTYRRLMGIIIAALYVFSPQGRCQGIEDLKLGQVEQLLQEGYAQTTKFKTQAKWGFQPVTLSTESKELLTIYLRTFRPVVVGREVPSQPQDALLLTFSGQPYSDIGKELTIFYRNSCNLHITSTRIRSIVETAAEEMYRAGDISLKVRKSIEAINGHTSATVQNYYLQMDRAADVHSARSFFTQAASPDSSTTSPPSAAIPVDDDRDIVEACTPLELRIQHAPSTAATSAHLTTTWTSREGTKHLDWGSSHPEYERHGVRKVRWSEQELDYIENWIEKNMQGDTNLQVSRCLTSIRQDPRAVQIFHAHHILNSARLRNGFERVMNKTKLELESFVKLNQVIQL